MQLATQIELHVTPLGNYPISEHKETLDDWKYAEKLGLMKCLKGATDVQDLQEKVVDELRANPWNPTGRRFARTVLAAGRQVAATASFVLLPFGVLLTIARIRRDSGCGRFSLDRGPLLLPGFDAIELGLHLAYGTAVVDVGDAGPADRPDVIAGIEDVANALNAGVQ